jgi:2-keto-4-pentenoate hydratase
MYSAADLIWEAHQRGEPCAPVRDLIGATDIERAYAVQKINTDRWLVRGRRAVGRKIGLTSVAVQQPA